MTATPDNKQNRLACKVPEVDNGPAMDSVRETVLHVLETMKATHALLIYDGYTDPQSTAKALLATEINNITAKLPHILKKGE